MTLLKKCLPDILAVLLFAVLAFAYFFPADIEGRILYRHDASAGRGAGQEGIEYLQKTGERSRWTNSLFGGMPTYQMAPSYGSTNLLTKAVDAYHLWLPENVWFVFAYLLGFYILLRAFDFRQHLAALGSIIWAFSTYFLIIIAAGHIWKVWALAYLPPMIAGVVLAYKGRYLWGPVLGYRMVCRGHPTETAGALCQGHSRMYRWCSHRCVYQSVESVSHLAVQQGVDAWQERVGETEQSEPDQQRSGARLYHAVELWYR